MIVVCFNTLAGVVTKNGDRRPPCRSLNFLSVPSAVTLKSIPMCLAIVAGKSPDDKQFPAMTANAQQAHCFLQSRNKKKETNNVLTLMCLLRLCHSSSHRLDMLVRTAMTNCLNKAARFLAGMLLGEQRLFYNLRPNQDQLVVI